MKTKGINISEVFEKDIEYIEQGISEIKDVIPELNSLIVKMPFIVKVDQELKKKLVEKIRVIYANTSEIFVELNRMKDILDRKELKEYVKEYSKYIDAYVSDLSILVHSINQYIKAFSYKFEIDDDMDAIYTYYCFIIEMVDSKYRVLLDKLREMYYKNQDQ